MTRITMEKKTFNWVIFFYKQKIFSTVFFLQTKQQPGLRYSGVLDKPSRIVLSVRSGREHSRLVAVAVGMDRRQAKRKIAAATDGVSGPFQGHPNNFKKR